MAKHTILFLAANPLGTDRLALDHEARAIQSELAKCRHGNEFEVITRWTIQPLDLLGELRRLKPTVVHFSGHGVQHAQRERSAATAIRRDVAMGRTCHDGDGLQPCLLFESPNGSSQFVSSAALAEIFGASGASVKLVVLNACYSSGHAEALLSQVDCVVGMSGSIGDTAARYFAIGFYGGIGDGESIDLAYKQGRASAKLDTLPDGDKPQLRCRDGIHAAHLILAATGTADAALLPSEDLEADSHILGKRIDKNARSRSRNLDWTWFSSVDSADSGVVSVLAIFETITASVLYVWIACTFGTLHLVVSTCIAPFLLMKTRSSMNLALEYYQGIALTLTTQLKSNSTYDVERGNIETLALTALEKISVRVVFKKIPMFFGAVLSSGWGTILLAFTSLPILSIVIIFIHDPISGCLIISFLILSILLLAFGMCLFLQLVVPGMIIIVRGFAALSTIIRSPLESISEIPRNWTHSVVCVDSCHPLELLPGAHRRYPSSGYNFLVPWRLINSLLRRRNSDHKAGIIILCLRYILVIAFGSMLIIPALIYRWSLKGSAVIYSPLIWMAHGAMARPIGVHLQDILTLSYYRVSRWFASFVLIACMAKIYIHYAWQDLASSWVTVPGHRFLEVVVMPAAFPGWQVTSVLNACLAWVIYLVADWATVRWERGIQLRRRRIDLTMRWLFLMRGILSVYTIACWIYLAASLSGHFGLPPMTAGIVPWR